MAKSKAKSKKPPAMKVLVVDSARITRNSLVNICKMLPYRCSPVEQAENGEEALEMLKRFVPDLVIADWDLPDMTGRDLFVKIKSNAPTRNAKMVIVTNKRPQHEMDGAKKSGVASVIEKPVTLSVLRDEVKDIYMSVIGG